MREIYIPGVEMPTRCGRCDMCIPAYDDGIFDHYECCITAAIIDNLGEKMEDCPLVPVPPHGRLIDADALSQIHGEFAYEKSGRNYGFHMTAKAWIDEAPTIIPADPAEGDTAE